MSAAKIIAASPIPPAPARIVPSAQGEWRWVNNLGGNGSDMSEKIIAASPIPPIPGRSERTTLLLDNLLVRAS